MIDSPNRGVHELLLRGRRLGPGKVAVGEVAVEFRLLSECGRPTPEGQERRKGKYIEYTSRGEELRFCKELKA